MPTTSTRVKQLTTAQAMSKYIKVNKIRIEDPKKKRKKPKKPKKTKKKTKKYIKK